MSHGRPGHRVRAFRASTPPDVARKRLWSGARVRKLLRRRGSVPTPTPVPDASSPPGSPDARDASVKRILPCMLAMALAAPGLAAQRGASGADAPPMDGRALVDRAERMQDMDDAGALRLLDRALPLLTAPADRPLRMRALGLRCWSLASTAEAPAVVRAAEHGMAEAARAGDARAVADLRVCRGYASSEAGALDAAAADYDFGAAEGRRLGDARLLADASVFRGELRYYRGEMAGGLEDFKQAYGLYRRLGNAGRQRYTLIDIANLYADARVADYDRAIEYYRQVLEANRAAGLGEGVSTAYYNLGSTYESKGDLAGALGYYRRALELEQRAGDAGEAAYTQRSIGIVLAKQGRPAQALGWFGQALAHFDRAGDAERGAQARLSRAVALDKLGRWTEALADLETARARFEKPRNARFLERVHAERALAFAGLGDWRHAFEARTAQLDLQRELAERLKEEHTSRLRVQFDTEKKEAENRALLRENRLRGQALADGARIRALQTAVIALGFGIVAVLAWLVFKHVAAERRMRTMALTDELTRLPNRRHLLALADEGLHDARRQAAPFSVLALDVDHFKRVNDEHGHDVGDEVLRRVAAACRAALREGDHVGRTGGEEFVVVLPRTDAARALEVAERLRGAVEGLDWDEVAPGLRVTLSVGVAERTPADAGFGEVSKRADDSLYRAKAGGRNRVDLAGV
ncbi:MAG: hypothetical protein JWM27_1312 [Gemmatimonadetes bacterium]|nr:hypothetical protein [Gemmatimonadota bacterium]